MQRKTLIPFLNYLWPTVILSCVLLLAALALLVGRGLNFGIDFTGGALVQIQAPQAEGAATQSVGDVRQALTDAGMTQAVIQTFGAANEFLIRLPQGDQDVAARVQEALPAVDIRRVEFVGPQIGDELQTQGLMALLVSLGAILLYVTMRFEFRYGIGAILALVHDVWLTLGVFALTQKEFTLPVLAALLTIIGYSLNDTIVVYDRIRENRRNKKKMPLRDVLNLSLTQMLRRTLMTSFTTLLVLLALYLFGGAVIHDFAFTLLFGVVVGTYSSIFVAAPVLLFMEKWYLNREDNADKDTETS